MIWRWIGFVALVLLLLLTAYSGLTDGLENVRHVVGVGQWMTIAAQLLFGVCAILALAAMGARHGSAKRFLYGWCVGTTLTSGLAPVVYGGANLLIGFVSGAAGAIISFIMLWLWKNRPAGVHA